MLVLHNIYCALIKIEIVIVIGVLVMNSGGKSFLNGL